MFKIQTVKNIAFLCMIAFFVGASLNLGSWAMYRILDYLELLAVG